MNAQPVPALAKATRLKGVAPAELPVEQSDAWKLTVNLKAAAQLGLTISASLLARADEVIE